jgi:hypothetical protein
MHKRIRKGEDPTLLTDVTIYPKPNEKIGPGW